MNSRAGYSMLGGDSIDDIVVFWRSGDERRAVFSWDYTRTQDYAADLLERRFDIQATGITKRLSELSAPGSVLAFTQPTEVVGVMRPWIIDPSAVHAIDAPFLIAHDPNGVEQPLMPVLTATRDDAVTFVQALADNDNVDIRGWRQFKCEPLLPPLLKLLADLAEHRSNLPTELERALCDFRNETAFMGEEAAR